MKCQNCNKKEANVRYYENINGDKREIILCSECAEKLDLVKFPDMLSFFTQSYPKKINEKEYLTTVCDKCSYTFDDYLNTGFFGCPNCYSSFSDRIDSLLYKMYGKNRHRLLQDYSINNRKKESKINNINSIEELKKMQEIAIKEEKYEDAAKIRDRIKEIEGE